jgi:hypothetical protein
MKITQRADGGYLIRDGEITKSVPPDPANRDYEMMQEIIADGAVVEMEPPPPEPEPVLTRLQWQFFLRVTGFGAVLQQALDAMPQESEEDVVRWAAMSSLAHDATDYPLSTTLAVKAVIAELGLPVAMPDDAAIEAAFRRAAAFKGAASVIR